MCKPDQPQDLESLSKQYADELRAFTASCSSIISFLDSLATPDRSENAIEGSFRTLDDYVALRDKHESFMDVLQKLRWSLDSRREQIMESLFTFIKEGCND